MTINIEKLIEQRPHLKDPFEFYAKWQRFQRDADEILPRSRATLAPAESKAYPRKNVDAVLKSFAAAFHLSSEVLSPIGKALAAGDIDFMLLPLDELPPISLPQGEGELSTILFLLSKPWFIRLREVSGLDGRQWEEGHCPVCSARPALASIIEGPQRRLHCSWCGATGPYRFIGCPNCGAEEAVKLGTLVPEGEPGFRVATCDACRTYVKVVESQIFEAMTPDLADLASLPLDIVAQGKDYARRAPNPLGLLQIP
ncbi:MAG: formate dehydrogenase accessory protein FdhE [Desulfobulbus sp.]|nr:MAG: formate dehydrogenase accessory protein FdhE [Desulfobulbus sp.]